MNNKEIIFYLKNILLISVMFFILTSNSVFMPNIISLSYKHLQSTTNTNNTNINKEAIEINKNLITAQCDHKCANNCLFSESSSNENLFAICLGDCNCKYNKIDHKSEHDLFSLKNIAILLFVAAITKILYDQKQEAKLLAYLICKKYNFNMGAIELLKTN